MTSFGDLLRDHRRAAGLTQEQLAERAGVSPRSISELERGGAHIPRRDTVGLLARALELQPAEREAFEQLVEGRRRERPTHRQPPVATAQPASRPVPAAARLLTSIVGRERELEELAGALRRTPLLTLTGAGGVGKTRLAQELAQRVADSFPDGACAVELAGLTEGELVPGALAAGLGLPDLQSRDTVGLLAKYLRDKHLLLVLDNCEHLVQACAATVGPLLRGCPQLQVLATSREPLNIAGESTWRVLPLQVPEPTGLTFEHVVASPAVRLFIERAQAVSNTLTLSPTNAVAIARICIGVDGIPLALELAAARTRMLTLEQLADRLDRDADILRSAQRDGLPQHRTMRATIDWSHDLLDPREQMLLRRVSVFAGGWTLELAEDVCAGDGIEPSAVLDVMAQLVDKSMVQVDIREGVARYRLLEPIRQYASEQLAASHEAAVVRARHSSALLRFAQTGESGRPGADEISSLDRLEAEHDNLRAALHWALHNDQAAAALRCSAALFRFWERRGHFHEGCAWLEQALAGAPDAPGRDRGWALNALAFLYWRCGDYERALPVAQQALLVTREWGQTRDVAQSLLNLGMIAYFRDEPDVAVARLEESVQYARQAAFPAQLSLALVFLGRTLVWACGPHEPRAAAAIEEGLRLAESAGSRYAMGHGLMTLGDLYWRQEETSAAIPLWRAALAVRSQLADRRGIAGSLERLAWAMADTDQFVAAAWFFGAADAQHKVLGLELRHDEEVDHAALLARTHRELGPLFSGAWSAGRSATLDEAISRGLEAASQPAALAWSSR